MTARAMTAILAGILLINVLPAAVVGAQDPISDVSPTRDLLVGSCLNTVTGSLIDSTTSGAAVGVLVVALPNPDNVASVDYNPYLQGYEKTRSNEAGAFSLRLTQGRWVLAFVDEQGRYAPSNSSVDLSGRCGTTAGVGVTRLIPAGKPVVDVANQVQRIVGDNVSAVMKVANDTRDQVLRELGNLTDLSNVTRDQVLRAIANVTDLVNATRDEIIREANENVSAFLNFTLQVADQAQQVVVANTTSPVIMVSLHEVLSASPLTEAPLAGQNIQLKVNANNACSQPYAPQPNATTDADGAAVFSGLPPAPTTYCLIFTGTGYDGNSTNVTTAANTTSFVAFHAYRTARTVVGTVRDNSTSPKSLLPAAAVVGQHPVFCPNGNSSVPDHYTCSATSTGLTGQYSLVLPADSSAYSVTAAHQGYTNATGSITVPVTGPVVGPTLSLDRFTGTVSGTARDKDASGQPALAGVLVTFTGAATGNQGNLTTNATGGYRKTLPFDNYHLTFSKANYALNAEDVDLAAGGSVTQDEALTRSAGNVSGIVRDMRDGSPLANVFVNFTSPNFEVQGGVLTNASGAYTKAIPYGTWTVTFSKETYRNATATVDVLAGATTTEDATLARVLGTMTGVVTGLNVTTGVSFPLIGADVCLSTSLGFICGVTDGTGTYLLHLAWGHYDVSVSASGFLTQTTPVTIAPSATLAKNFRLAPAGYGDLQGLVCDALVTGCGWSGSFPVVAVKQGSTVVKSAAADATGAFDFQVPVGTYSLEATLANYATLTLAGVVVAEGQATISPQMNLTRSTYTLTVTALDSDVAGIKANAPLKNATITVTGFGGNVAASCGSTNAIGACSLANLPWGSYNVTVAQAAPIVYDAATATRTFAANDSFTVRVVRHAVDTIAGHVFDGTVGPAAGLAGATVTADLPALDGAFYTLSATSDAMGVYALTVPNGTSAPVAAAKPAYTNASRAWTSGTLDFTLSRHAGNVTGRLQDVSVSPPQPLAGATLDFTGAAVGGQGSITTGADGNFTKANLPFDTYSVSVNATNYVGGPFSLAVLPDAALAAGALNMSRQAGTIRGVVVDDSATGHPGLAGATIAFVGEATGSQGTATANATGAFSKSLPFDHYNLTVSLADYGNVTPGGVDLSPGAMVDLGNLALQRSTGSISGAVFDGTATGNPAIAGATVTFIGAAVGNQGSVTTGADGAFSKASLPFDAYTVNLAKANYVQANITQALPAGAAASLGNQSLARLTGTIQGMVADGSATAQPGLAGATLAFVGNATGSQGTATANATGAFSKSLPFDQYNVTITLPVYVSRTAAGSLGAGATLDLGTLALQRSTGNMSGVVLDGMATGSPVLAGATVAFVGDATGSQGSVITGANGTFAKQGLPFDAYTLNISKAGYVSLLVARTVAAGANVATGNISLLRMTGTVSGHVVDADAADGRALAAVTVAFMGTDTGAQGTAVTGNDGNFSQTLPFDSYTLNLTRASYQSRNVTAALAAGAAADLGSQGLARVSGTFTGVVRDGTAVGKPALAGAAVHFVGNETADRGTATSNATGGVAKSVPFDAYAVNVTASGYEFSALTREVLAPGATVDLGNLDIARVLRNISGRVNESLGFRQLPQGSAANPVDPPVSDLVITCDGAATATHVQATTDASGNYALAAPIDSYTCATPEGTFFANSTQVTLGLAGGVHNFTLERKAWVLRGTVRDALAQNGAAPAAPIAGATVCDVRSDTSVETCAQTDEAGNFALGVTYRAAESRNATRTNEVVLRVTAPDYNSNVVPAAFGPDVGTAPPPPVPVFLVPTVNKILIQANVAAGVIEGLVYDRDAAEAFMVAGPPVPGASLTAVREDGPCPNLPLSVAPTTISSISGPSGHYVIPVPCAGDYDLTVSQPLYRGPVKVVVHVPQGALVPGQPAPVLYQPGLALNQFVGLRRVATSNVTVRVLDQNLAGVAQAGVDIVGLDTQERHFAVSDANGEATLVNLPWGAYAVAVNAPYEQPFIVGFGASGFAAAPGQEANAQVLLARGRLAPATIQGKIVDADALDGLDGVPAAVVTAVRTAPCPQPSNSSTFLGVSRVDGSYTIVVPCDGNYNVTVAPPGGTALYEHPQGQDVLVPTGDAVLYVRGVYQPANVTGVNFTLSRAAAGAVTIQALDARSGQPVPGASVHVAGATVRGSQDGVTDVAGNATFQSLKWGAYAVRVVGPSGTEWTLGSVDRPAEAAFVAAPGTSTDGKVLLISGAGSVGLITGYVRDGTLRTGLPNGVPGAVVTATRAMPCDGRITATSFSAATRVDGGYAVAVPCAGDYVLSVAPPGASLLYAAPENATVTVPAGAEAAPTVHEPAPVEGGNFTLARAAAGDVTVTVYDVRTAQPVAGAFVEAMGIDVISGAAQTTNASGIAVFHGLPWGAYGARVMGPDPASQWVLGGQRASATAWVAAPAAPVSAVGLLASGSAAFGLVSGRVTDGDRAPGLPQGVPGALITATRDSPCPGPAAARAFSAPSGPDGSFTMVVACSGRYVVSVVPLGGPVLYHAPVDALADVPEGDVTSPGSDVHGPGSLSGLNFTLMRTRAGEVAVTVLDLHTGQGVPGALVRAVGLDVAAEASQVTNGSGVATFQGLAWGAYRADVTAPPAASPWVIPSSTTAFVAVPGVNSRGMAFLVGNPGAPAAGVILGTLRDADAIALLSLGVSGAVVTATRDAPCADSAVTSPAFTSASTANGTYAIIVPCPGNYVVSVTPPAGLYAAPAPVTVVVAQGAEASPGTDVHQPSILQGVDFSLARTTGAVSVLVLDARTGQPVAGAFVDAAGVTVTNAAFGTTGFDGTATFAVKWGAYAATVTGPAGTSWALGSPTRPSATAFVAVPVAPTRSVALLSDGSSPAGTLTGRIADGDRASAVPAGVPGTVVTATLSTPCPPPLGGSSFASVSRADGNYTIVVPCSGTYTISAAPPGGSALYAPVANVTLQLEDDANAAGSGVHAPGTAVANFTFARTFAGTVTVVVKDLRTGQPVQGATVHATGVDVRGQALVLTDASGQANFTGLAWGAYTAQLIGPAGTTWYLGSAGTPSKTFFVAIPGEPNVTPGALVSRPEACLPRDGGAGLCESSQSDHSTELVSFSVATSGPTTFGKVLPGEWMVLPPGIGQAPLTANTSTSGPVNNTGPDDGTWVVVYEPDPGLSVGPRDSYTLTATFGDGSRIQAKSNPGVAISSAEAGAPLVWIFNAGPAATSVGCLPIATCDGADPVGMSGASPSLNATAMGDMRFFLDRPT